MTLNVNQFQQSDVKGRLDNRSGANQSMSVRLDVSSAGGVIPGQCVKMLDSLAKQITVIECAANSDDSFGVVIYSQIKNLYAAGDMMEVLVGRNGIIIMEASAAMLRGAKVSAVIAGSQIKTAATGEMIIGRLLDKAVNVGDLVRVALDLPGSLAP
jgi:hypothetical protein